MVLDEDIDQEQDSVTSRLGRITLCFVLPEIIPRQVFTHCFTTMVSPVLNVLKRFGRAVQSESHTYSMVVAEFLDQQQDS